MKNWITPIWIIAMCVTCSIAIAGENKERLEPSAKPTHSKWNVATGTIEAGSAIALIHLTSRDVRLLASDVRGNERLFIDKVVGLDSLKKSQSKLATAKLVRNVAFLPQLFYAIDGLARVASGLNSDRDLGWFAIDDVYRLAKKVPEPKATGNLAIEPDSVTAAAK